MRHLGSRTVTSIMPHVETNVISMKASLTEDNKIITCEEQIKVIPSSDNQSMESLYKDDQYHQHCITPVDSKAWRASSRDIWSRQK